MSTQGDLRQSLRQRAEELFALCDYNGKGFAYREDLGALCGELPLSPDQLQDVFDALDVDGDGCLTLQEFTDGFGMFLGIDTRPLSCRNNANFQEDEDEDEILEDLLDHLGARNLFTDEDFVREMWHRVKKDDPMMRSNFENFISKMALNLKETVEDKENLQSTLKSREQENESRVQSLYKEMEEQLQRDKEDALAREQRKEQQLRDELETELQAKDEQLQDLLQKHAQMEKQLEELNSEEAETKYENQKLEKNRDILESRLADSEKMLQDMKNHLTLLRKKSLEEKRKRAHAALKVSEDIALERENLVLELQSLKEMNKQLLDEKDELVQNVAQFIPAHKSVHRKKPSKLKEIDEVTEESMENVQTDYSLSEMQAHPVSHSLTESHPVLMNGILTEVHHPVSLNRILTEEHPLSEDLGEHNSLECSDTESKLLLDYVEEDDEVDIHNNLNFPTAKIRNAPNQHHKHCTQPKAESNKFPKSKTNSMQDKGVEQLTVPSRVFKVVFVGDSGVGKTSILQRFCCDDFKATYSATIGVDFQIKTVTVEGERIALQLWDTAGQERFRSMTQQYFRKADGIIVVYDVTTETSFKNVRNWMYSVQEGAEDNAAVLLMGNKIDLCESENDRVVKAKDGEKLADEYGTLFYETSAKTGSTIIEAIEALASVLKTKEDETMEQVLKLQEEMRKKKKKCC